MHDAEPLLATKHWRGSAGSLFQIAVWFGLATGIGEVLILLFQRHVLGHFIWASSDIVWMTPLSYLTYFVVAALVLWLLLPARAAGRTDWPVFGFACLGVACLLLAVGGLHWWAIALLSIGVGLQAGRIARNWRPDVAKFVRRSTVIMVAAVVIAAGALYTIRRVRSARMLAEPAARQAPNVVFIVLDCVRAASMSLYGYQRPTSPKLEHWAARGVVFDRAIATAPWTLPSHASMFTGRLPHELSADWYSPLDTTYPTIAEAFVRGGYITAALTANYFYATREAGLARGIVHFEGRARSMKQVLYSSVVGQVVQSWLGGEKVNERVSDRKDALRMTDAALRFVSTADRPFFVFMNYFDAHKPYDPGPRVQTTHHKLTRAGYEAAILSLDEQVDRLLTGLEERGVLKNTIVVITSDHGETFGEHGLRGHGHSLYLSVLRVPLIMIGSGVPAGSRIPHPVSLRDLPATLVELSQLRTASQFGGSSLTRFWREGASDTSTVLSEVWPGRTKLPKRQPVSKGEMVSLIRDSLHYILNGDATEELYNINRDPFESINIAATEDSMLLEFRPAAHVARAELTRRFRVAAK